MNVDYQYPVSEGMCRKQIGHFLQNDAELDQNRPCCLRVISNFTYWQYTDKPSNGPRDELEHVSVYQMSWLFKCLREWFSLLFLNHEMIESLLKTYAAISNAHLFRVCKRGKLSGSCLSTLNRFGSIQLPIFLCHIGVPTFSSQNN